MMLSTVSGNVPVLGDTGWAARGATRAEATTHGTSRHIERARTA